MKPSVKGSSLLGCADVDIRVGDRYYIVDLRFLLFLSSRRPVKVVVLPRSLKFLRVL
jgi:hypothetical protein